MKWENNMVFAHGYGEFMSMSNQWGEEGWEVSSVVLVTCQNEPVGEYAYDHYAIFFKRPLVEPTPIFGAI